MLARRPRPSCAARGFTLLELVIAMGLMATVLLAGTHIVHESVKFERHMAESMDSAAVEVLVTDRLYQDLKYAGPSFNFLMRFDDGRDAYGRCRKNGHTDTPQLDLEKRLELREENEKIVCYDASEIVPTADHPTNNKMADYDFFLYDSACVGANQCYRSITFNASDTYPDGLAGKHDFVIISTDTMMKNTFGIDGGLEF